ncbi:MAG TPA: hypothetical protein VFH51_09875, partial [Myxococcota bacterium]|nr:hypothetical protein [Myxococcota bacterium]
QFLGSEECAVPLPGADKALLRQQAAQAVVALGPHPSAAALAAALGRPLKRHLTGEDIDDLAVALLGPLEDLWQISLGRTRADGLLAAAGLRVTSPAFRDAVTSAMLDLRNPAVLVPAEGSTGAPLVPFSARVSGQPLLNRALSNSLWRNEAWFVGTVGAMLLTGMALWCRSLRVGILAALPALTGLVLTGAGMVLLGLQVDMSTLTITALVLALGVDYAVHGVAALHLHAEVASCRRVVATSALAVSCAFLVLGFAQARPVHALGQLTAAGAVAVAVATGVLLSALAGPLQRAWAQHSH